MYHSLCLLPLLSCSEHGTASGWSVTCCWGRQGVPLAPRFLSALNGAWVMCLGPAGPARGLIQNLRLLRWSSSSPIQLSAHLGSESKMWDAQLCHGFVEPLACMRRGGMKGAASFPAFRKHSWHGLWLLLCSDCSSSLVKSHLVTTLLMPVWSCATLPPQYWGVPVR